MNLITMDPGDNTALVFWSDMKKPVLERFVNLNTKQKKLSISQRHLFLCQSIKSELKKLKYYYPGENFKFIIEGVTLWGASEKSQAAAKRGDSFRLAYLVGGMISTFDDVFPGSEIEVVTVQQWKGGLPTPILISEVTRYTGRVPANEHVACAIGIGMNYFGELG